MWRILPRSRAPQQNNVSETHLLTKARFHVLSFSAMNECRVFVVETVKTMGLLVDKGVVLRHELPANFGWNDVGVGSGGIGGGHDGWRATDVRMWREVARRGTYRGWMSGVGGQQLATRKNIRNP
jgi:hypothetical protein